MIRILKIFLPFILLLSASGYSQEIKKADLAGSWYPANEKSLSRILDSYLQKAQVPEIQGRILAIISPHAGLRYSGPIAAYGFKLLQNTNPKTVIILGFSHRKYFEGISIYNKGKFQTPLGDITVDSVLADEISSFDNRIRFLPEAFSQENSVEMMLPFIKKVLPEARIVPLAFGNHSFENCQLLSKILVKILKERHDVVLVASTDLSHYHSYRKAIEIDKKTITLIEKFAAEKIYQEVTSGKQLCCGFMPVITTILVGKKINDSSFSILKYANSGDTSFDKSSRVVGYVAAALYTGQNQNSKIDEAKGGKMQLSKEDKKTLLHIARKTLQEYLSSSKVPEFTADSGILQEVRGAFVTLKKHGNLRGCIGNIIGRDPLYLTVQNMAIEAATADPRFPSVSLEELKDIEIEISVLSPLKKVTHQDIILGTHGVIVKKGLRQGVYLPQVATETGWTKEEFLSSLCAHKAGLPPTAWKDKDTELYVFTACVFSEKDVD